MKRQSRTAFITPLTQIATKGVFRSSAAEYEPCNTMLTSMIGNPSDRTQKYSFAMARVSGNAPKLFRKKSGQIRKTAMAPNPTVIADAIPTLNAQFALMILFDSADLPAPSAEASLLVTATTTVKVANWLTIPKTVLLGAIAAKCRTPSCPMHTVSTMARRGSRTAAAAHVPTCTNICLSDCEMSHHGSGVARAGMISALLLRIPSALFAFFTWGVTHARFPEGLLRTFSLVDSPPEG
mmetsp:Transcript_26392/g.44195  ORF Transcript_26392/g.44195 Transcript_26392/m.44195 type:complete len:238 (-) Transcript_26392:825-1538(-)